jgi:hypothetical protein
MGSDPDFVRGHSGSRVFRRQRWPLRTVYYCATFSLEAPFSSQVTVGGQSPASYLNEMFRRTR